MSRHADPHPQQCQCGCGDFVPVNNFGKRNRYITGHRSGVNYETRSISERIAGVEEWVMKRDAVSTSTLATVAKQFHLTPKEARVVIDRARLKLAANAERYVQAHIESVETALEIGTESALAVAQRGSEWAMERIGQGNSRVIDAPKSTGGTGGPQILIGISVGGIKPQPQAIEAESESVPRVMITDGTLVEPPILEKQSFPAPPQPQPPGKKEPSYKVKRRLKHEAKIQKLLMAVTPDTAQVVTRSIIDFGYNPAFAWEMVKEMLEVDERAAKAK